MYKIGMISLGCPKNQVDAERMLAQLDKNGFQIADCYEGVDAVIINTCGFIDAAKQEAIENILEMAQLKEEGTVKKTDIFSENCWKMKLCSFNLAKRPHFRLHLKRENSDSLQTLIPRSAP